MSSYYSILEKSGALTLLLAALFLTIVQIAVFALSFQENSSRRQIIISAIHMAAGFLIFVILLEGYDIVNYPQIPRRLVYPGWFPFRLPWVFYLLLEGFSAGILSFQFWEYRRHRTYTVTPGVVRQTMDLLPEGICISDPDGTILLSNLKMNEICREFSGERLSDAGKLWRDLDEKGEEQNGRHLIHTPRGEIWLFSKGTLSADGKEYDRTNAVNITERYRIREELQEKNAHLLDIQRRMKEAAQLSGEVFVKQEEFTTRTALHNELGQVLLMGRHYLEHPGSADADMVILMTKQMNRFLLGESEIPEPGAGDELSLAVRMAKSIGVSAEIPDDPRLGTKARSLLAEAVRECAANTAKHASGDKLTVSISKGDGQKDLVINITNNGIPPKGTIVESGGLLALRRSIEAAGGQMAIQSLPVFTLTLFLNNE